MLRYAGFSTNYKDYPPLPPLFLCKPSTSSSTYSPSPRIHRRAHESKTPSSTRNHPLSSSSEKTRHDLKPLPSFSQPPSVRFSKRVTVPVHCGLLLRKTSTYSSMLRLDALDALAFLRPALLADVEVEVEDAECECECRAAKLVVYDSRWMRSRCSSLCVRRTSFAAL
jgi:hypothetical protein